MQIFFYEAEPMIYTDIVNIVGINSPAHKASVDTGLIMHSFVFSC